MRRPAVAVATSLGAGEAVPSAEVVARLGERIQALQRETPAPHAVGPGRHARRPGAAVSVPVVERAGARRGICGLLGILVLALACGGCGEQRPLTVANLDELSLRMSAFHRQPTQDEFTVLVNSFARFDGDRQMRESASLMAAFIVFATERYGFTVDGLPDSQALARFRTADRVRFGEWLADGSTSPQKNDVWWVAFFCTGEERWLDLLLEVVASDGTRTAGDPAVIDLAGRSARWSYKSNVAQWEEVQHHAERHADHGNAFAAECVAYAKEHPELRRR